MDGNEAKKKKKEDEILSLILIIMNIALLFPNEACSRFMAMVLNGGICEERVRRNGVCWLRDCECRHASEARPAQYD